jgi:hypothetical protein
MIRDDVRQDRSVIMFSMLRLALLSLTVATLPSPLSAQDAYAVYESESDFDTVMEAAKLAIQERGLYVNDVMHIGAMLERTGKDLGLGQPIYDQAVSIEFCSAILSRKMATEDPRRIVNCPFILSIYTLPDRPGTTYVAHRVISPQEIETSAAMAEVAQMLQGVAQGATSW